MLSYRFTNCSKGPVKVKLMTSIPTTFAYLAKEDATIDGLIGKLNRTGLSALKPMNDVNSI